jgi:hypothetical protein
MAEAAAALYAVETAVEGAAVTGIAVSKATVPLYVKYQKLQSPNPTLSRSNHSLNIIKNKAYLFGGDSEDANTDSDLHVLTLPTDLSQDELNLDYRCLPSEPAPSRPLAAYSDEPGPPSESNLANEVPSPRSGHATTVVGTNIYVFGGRSPLLGANTSTSNSPLKEDGIIHAYSTMTSKWTTLRPRVLLCAQGVPSARINASLTSSPHPTASSADVDLDPEHNSGTLFLHSGYSADSKTASREVWMFDISSRVWSQWADVPAPSAEETAGEGRLLCFESRLWRVGDGFGIVHYFDIVRDKADDAWGDSTTELGVSPKTGSWEKLSFSTDQSPAEEVKGKSEDSDISHPTDKADSLPIPRSAAGFLPVTTGAGREYLLYFLGNDAPGSAVNDIWCFQIASEAKSMAKAKDKIREAVGKSSGENQWSKCEVVEATKKEGELERPDGLFSFAADVWTDFGGAKVVVWGGKTPTGSSAQNGGWIMNVE